MTLRTVLPENHIDLQIRQPLSMDADDLQRRAELERRLTNEKARMGSRWILHNYNPTVRIARSTVQTARSPRRGVSGTPPENHHGRCQDYNAVQ